MTSLSPRRGPARRLPGPVLLAGLLLITALWPAPAVARREKTLFRSQPTEWGPESDHEDHPAKLRFDPLWTFDAFRSPLVGPLKRMGEALIAASEDGTLAAIRQENGELIWSYRIPEPPATGPETASGMVIQPGRGGTVFAIRDGMLVWSVDLGSPAAVPPRVLGGRLFVATADAMLRSLDPADGRILARHWLPGRPSTTLEPAPGAVLVGTAHGMLVALREDSLEVMWRHYAVRPMSAPPLVHAGRVYVAAADQTIRCLRLKSGRLLWRFDLGTLTTARMFVRRKNLYVLCFDNDIHVLQAHNGHLMTRVRLDHRLAEGGAESEQHLFVAPYTEGAVVGLTLPGLRKVGTYELDVPGEAFTTPPLDFGGRLALGYGREAGRILALRVVPEEPAEQSRAVPP